MIVRFTAGGMRDLGYWEATDARMVAKIRSLIGGIQASPYAGLGKPEALKGDLGGWWSRRITKEHRLIYRINTGAIEISRCRYHYTK